MRLGGERRQQRFARHARTIFLGGQQRKAVVLGAHDQFGGLFGAEAVMIGKRLTPGDRDAGLGCGREKLVRITDAGEGEHLARFQLRDGRRVWLQVSMKDRQTMRGGNGVAGTRRLADHQQRVGARDLHSERRPQGSCGKHARVAEAAPSIDDR